MYDAPFTISQITAYIKQMFLADVTLQSVWVEGEVSNFTQAASGHCYFTLKDAGAALRCVMWKSSAARLADLPRNGDAVEAYGGISVYEQRGEYQLYVQELRPAGIGRLYEAFEALKQRLAAEGLFDESRKRPLPVWPRRIGVVTSTKGAALRDILRVLSHRFPLGDVLIAPAAVQGYEAPPQIVSALVALNQHTSPPDVIILARGGGSIEDLWAFNDEEVARSIAASRIPVVAGVGHETDFTIADFVADQRAPTPSAAAALVVPDVRELRDQVRVSELRLSAMVRDIVMQYDGMLQDETRVLRRYSPEQIIANYRQRVDDLTLMAGQIVGHAVSLHRSRLETLRGRLLALSPLAVLERGYAVVGRQDTREVVSRCSQAPAGTRLWIRVSDGEFGATSEPETKSRET